MTDQTAQSPAEDVQLPSLRDRARRYAPYAAGVAVFAVASVLVGGRGRRAPVQLPELSSPDPRTPLPSGDALGEPLRRSAHFVRGHARADVHVNPYLRPRVRRGPESLTAAQVAELLARA